jgi:hypothetical protein
MVRLGWCVEARQAGWCAGGGALAWLAIVLLGTAAAVAQQRPASGSRPAKLPPIRTPEEKLQALEYFRQQMPAQRRATSVRFGSEELDKMLEYAIGSAPTVYAPLADDEAFCRRVYLDLCGRQPKAAELKQFTQSQRADKRSQLIDQLLSSDEYARRWAGFWTDVVFSRSAANRNRVNPQALRDWLADQFRANVGWDRIVAQLLAADGRDMNVGPDNFWLACENQPEQLASETARIFMGIQIQCAECHDHPFDRWKRHQFHEMAAFFARGKYMMPDLYNPGQQTEMQPRFLLGERPPEGLNADYRRLAVAAYLIYNPDNYWFARALVNRVWNELLGDGFYAVDSLGPDSDVTHKLVVNRLAYMFRMEDFNIRWVFRTVMNSRAYQRAAREVTSSEQLFTAVRPARLRADQLAASLQQVLDSDRLNALVERTFAVDPSVPLADVEGSIQQALLLMNNPVLQQRLAASPLKRDLLQIRDDRAMLRELYMNILSRSPTPQELQRGEAHLRRAANRSEAIEDLMWVLINSLEFLVKR